MAPTLEAPRVTRGRPGGGQWTTRKRREDGITLDGDWMSWRGIPHPVGGYDEATVDYDTIRYLRMGSYHRVGGPAHIAADGFEAWYFKGRLHREDGPAVRNADGTVEWWVDGRQVETVPRTF